MQPPITTAMHRFPIALVTTALALTVAVGPSLSAQQGSPGAAAAPLTGFDAYVAQAVKDWKAPGFAMAVVKDGQIVFAKGYGVRRLGSPEPVDDRTLFAVGSTTKAMTAAALGMLVDEGKVGWDDPVIKHLPWFALKDPYVTREIRIRDLLTHRAGVPNTDSLWYEQEMSSREIIGRLREVELETSTRTHFTYQNVMYATAGEVVAAASGMPWTEFVRTRIFAPLGMTGTIPTAATLSSQPNVASPHYEIDGTVAVIRNASVDAVAPAGSVWSSVRDMAQWLNLLLAGGTVGGPSGKRLLSDKVLAELFTPQTMVGPDAFYPTARLTKPHWTTYGLGWFQADYAGEKVDFHTGSIDGMVAIAGLIRDRHLGVFVLANLDHVELRHALMYRVFDAYLGRPARDWSADMRALYAGLAKEGEARRAKAEAERVTGTTPTLALDRYAGTYTSPLLGTLTLTMRDGRMHATYGTGFVGPLEHWHYDTFKATWEARWRGTSLATFRIDARGRVAAVTTDQGTFARVEP
jgi:CubicO group peptidase (beta-lactamase class C family)